MMQIVCCSYCDKELMFPFGTLSAEIKLRQHEWCDKCGHTRGQDRTYSFCNVGCLVEFMNDVINGRRELKLHD